MKSLAFQRNNVRVVGEGPRTVVLAHGFGTDQRAWRHQEAALAPNYRVVLFDHVGAGGADPEAYSPRRYSSLHSYAADAMEILADLGDVGPVDFVGHSMSGMIGLLAAIEEPARFRSLVMLEASPRYLDDEGYKGGFKQPDLDRLYDAMASNYQAWASGFAGVVVQNADRPELTQEFATGLLSIRPDIALSLSRLLYQSDHRADLPRLTVPTLVLQANDDIAVPPEVGAYLAQQIPRATLVQIDGYGHLPHLSAPAAVTEALLKFLS